MFQLAQHGTIFLDEIGDLAPALQGKLLRVLQEKEVHPVGAPAPVPTDARIVTATHRDLTTLVTEGRFRDDLLYRINVIEVRRPPASRAARRFGTADPPSAGQAWREARQARLLGLDRCAGRAPAAPVAGQRA